MSDILHFTLIMGAISSLFDAAMFLILVKGFHADETLFQTGWFLESIATQILVVFLIRSSRLPWRTTRPNAVLAVTCSGPWPRPSLSWRDLIEPGSVSPT
jgi:P-type Mg2+ transporter